jgi:hypothetical protein
VHRRSTLAIDVLEDHLTEPQRAVIPALVSLRVPGWKTAKDVIDPMGQKIILVAEMRIER